MRSVFRFVEVVQNFFRPIFFCDIHHTVVRVLYFAPSFWPGQATFEWIACGVFKFAQNLIYCQAFDQYDKTSVRLCYLTLSRPQRPPCTCKPKKKYIYSMCIKKDKQTKEGAIKEGKSIKVMNLFKQVQT